jgi:hypothetical protein
MVIVNMDFQPGPAEDVGKTSDSGRMLAVHHDQAGNL